MAATDLRIADVGPAVGTHFDWLYNETTYDERRHLQGQVVTPPTKTKPVDAVDVPQIGDINSFINSQASGTKFWFAPGVKYRMRNLGFNHDGPGIIPKANQQFLTDPANRAILDGGVDISHGVGGVNWTLDTSNGTNRWWRVWTEARSASNLVTATVCDSGFDCIAPDSVVYMGLMLKRIFSSAVVSGQFFIDYTADRIWIADNPTLGALIEMTSVRFAIAPSATVGGAGQNGVLVEGLEAKTFATRGQNGAFDSYSAQNWTFNYPYVHHNHGGGIRLGHATCVANWYRTEFNGQIGVKMQAGGDWHYGREIGNLTGGWKRGWEGGGSKYGSAIGSTIDYQYSELNNGAACWADVACDNITIWRCVSKHDLEGGGTMFYEVSYDGLVDQCIILWGNELQDSSNTFLWGSAILASTSNRLVATRNVVIDCYSGLGAIQQDRGVTGTNSPMINNEIHRIVGVVFDNNLVIAKANQFSGGASNFTTTPDTMWSGGLTYKNNIFYHTGVFFRWKNPSDPATTSTSSFSTVAAFEAIPGVSSFLFGNIDKPLTDWQDNFVPVGLEK